MNGELYTQLFKLIQGAVADKLLIWATLLAIIGFGGWAIMRGPSPFHVAAVAGLFLPVLALLLYYSKKKE